MINENKFGLRELEWGENIFMTFLRRQPLCYNNNNREKTARKQAQVFEMKQTKIFCLPAFSPEVLKLVLCCAASFTCGVQCSTVLTWVRRHPHLLDKLQPPLMTLIYNERIWERKEWMSSWPCFSDRTVSLWVLARGAAGMLAGRHNTLAHLPSHLPLPDEWKPQPVLPNLHPTAGNTQYLVLELNMVA